MMGEGELHRLHLVLSFDEFSIAYEMQYFQEISSGHLHYEMQLLL